MSYQQDQYTRALGIKPMKPLSGEPVYIQNNNPFLHQTQQQQPQSSPVYYNAQQGQVYKVQSPLPTHVVWVIPIMH